MGKSAEKEGIRISFFVEGSSAADSQTCRNEIWSRGSKNPMISQGTVKFVDLGGKPGVTYVIEGDYQKQHVKMQNAQVFIAHGGKCIDIHVSRFPFVEGADAQLALILSSATIEPLQVLTRVP